MSLRNIPNIKFEKNREIMISFASPGPDGNIFVINEFTIKNIILDDAVLTSLLRIILGS